MDRDGLGGHDRREDDDSILDRHEFELDGSFEPCRRWIYDEQQYCLSTNRCIRYVPTNSGKKLVCGRGHNHLHNGNLFIPAHEFADGETFGGLLPPELQPSDAQIRETRWKVSSSSKQRLEREKACAMCEAPPFDLYGGHDTTAAWEWISEHDPVLLSAIHDELRLQAGFELSSWFSRLSAKLREAVVKRLEMSNLAIDHGIPRKIGNQVWPTLTREERTFIQQDLLFTLCRMHNGSKSSKLIPLDMLTQMFLNAYYGGELAVAIQDARRWELFTNITESVYRRRASG